MTPEDAPRLLTFHERQPRENQYRRFLSPKPTLNDKELEHFTNIDFHDRVALVVEERGEFIAWASYERWRGRNDAEVAFMVAPEFQAAGLGTALQARLQEYAMSRNVRGFVFEILSHNKKMLRLAAHARGTITTSRDEDVVHVTTLFTDSGNTSRPPLPDSQDAQGRQFAA